ncbi:hypothetical protein JKP88DRAFT_218312 [Tribonema minus]|uniref:EF-hand domain-containing protein n=1 Tax=Tribonema minus TaxID=303371 RepID=A0A835Z5C4_9STRA|nr:hypothetical protein JKP88DRAFT_218312 [Tribonema minus]
MPAKAFSIFYLPLVTLSLAKCVADYSRLQMAKRTNRMRSHILKQHVNTERFEMLDQNQDQCLDKYEFLVGVLIQQSIISPGQVKEIEDRFDELDVDSSGFVTRADFSS